MIIHKKRFGATFAFIITRTDSDRVYISPITFHLGMYDRITIDFAGRRLHDFRICLFCQSQHINSSQYRSFNSFYGIVLIMYRGCGTSQIINFIDLRLIREFHIVKHKFKMRIPLQVGYILFRTGEKIIQAYHFVSVFNQPGTQMRAYKAGTTANQYFFHAALYFYMSEDHTICLFCLCADKCRRFG